MIGRLVAVGLGVAFGVSSGAHAGVVLSSFDDSLEGWVKGPTSDPTSVLVHVSAGGNPGGFARYTEGATGGIDYFEAPPAFHGNLAGFLGGTLSYDIRTTATTNLTVNPDVVLVGGGLTLVRLVGNPTLSFTTLTADLAPGGWRVSTLGGSVATEAQLLQVLTNVSSFRIRSDYRSGAETISLDNVTLTAIPEPAAIMLLGPAALVLRRRPG